MLNQGEYTIVWQPDALGLRLALVGEALSWSKGSGYKAVLACQGLPPVGSGSVLGMR